MHRKFRNFRCIHVPINEQSKVKKFIPVSLPEPYYFPPEILKFL